MFFYTVQLVVSYKKIYFFSRSKKENQEAKAHLR